MNPAASQQGGFDCDNYKNVHFSTHLGFEQYPNRLMKHPDHQKNPLASLNSLFHPLFVESPETHSWPAHLL